MNCYSSEGVNAGRPRAGAARGGGTRGDGRRGAARVAAVTLGVRLSWCHYDHPAVAHRSCDAIVPQVNDTPHDIVCTPFLRLSSVVPAARRIVAERRPELILLLADLFDLLRLFLLVLFSLLGLRSVPLLLFPRTALRADAVPKRVRQNSSAAA